MGWHVKLQDSCWEGNMTSICRMNSARCVRTIGRQPLTECLLGCLWVTTALRLKKKKKKPMFVVICELVFVFLVQHSLFAIHNNQGQDTWTCSIPSPCTTESPYRDFLSSLENLCVFPWPARFARNDSWGNFSVNMPVLAIIDARFPIFRIQLNYKECQLIRVCNWDVLVPQFRCCNGWC